MDQAWLLTLLVGYLTGFFQNAPKARQLSKLLSLERKRLRLLLSITLEAKDIIMGAIATSEIEDRVVTINMNTVGAQRMWELEASIKELEAIYPSDNEARE